jgi:hypothetical protein
MYLVVPPPGVSALPNLGQHRTDYPNPQPNRREREELPHSVIRVVPVARVDMVSTVQQLIGDESFAQISGLT